jgi:hypothetical protein
MEIPRITNFSGLGGAYPWSFMAVAVNCSLMRNRSLLLQIAFPKGYNNDMSGPIL